MTKLLTHEEMEQIKADVIKYRSPTINIATLSCHIATLFNILDHQNKLLERASEELSKLKKENEELRNDLHEKYPKAPEYHPQDCDCLRCYPNQ